MNSVVSGLANQKHIRIMAIDATELVSTAQQRHQLSPTATIGLGRVMSVAALMGYQLKNEQDMISIKIEGDGPLELIRVDANKQGDVVGFVNCPQVNLVNGEWKALSVHEAIGNGTLSVSRNYGLKDEFTSTIQLETGEIGDDFALYFAQSEQLPSAVAVGVSLNDDATVKKAGALLIQMMPGHDEADISMAQHIVQYLKPISQIYEEGMTPKELVLSLFDEVEIVEEAQAQFKCHCNEEVMRNVLKTISVKDLEELKHQDKKVTLECHYCNQQYTFDEDDLDEIICEKINYAKN